MTFFHYPRKNSRAVDEGPVGPPTMGDSEDKVGEEEEEPEVLGDESPAEDEETILIEEE